MMSHTTSDSDTMMMGVSSSEGSPPKAAPETRAQYYVRSPPGDSQEEDNKSSSSTCSTTQTGSTNSTLRSSLSEFQSLLSLLGRQSLSAASRVSRRKRGHRQRREREWRHLLGTVSEGEEEEVDGHEELSRSCKMVMWVIILGLLFLVGSFIIWGASTFSPHVLLKMQNLRVNDIYYGEGSDLTGVPTKMLTTNCSVKMRVLNPASFFAIYVSSSTITLRYFDLIIASGQMETYYQARKSWRDVSVNIQGSEVPLYGAATGFMDPTYENKLTDHGIPFILEFDVRFQGDLLGKLLMANFRHHVRCSLTFRSHSSHLLMFSRDSCTYD